jgi:transposase
MPKKVEYTPEFKDQAVRLVAAEREPNESRSAVCARLGPRLGVKTPTLYAWVKQAIPRADAVAAPGSVEELRAANAQLRKENRELARANDILQAAASFFGAELDRRSKK